MSTCRNRSRPPRRLRGDVLLESLISVLLMAIVGSGIVYITSRVSVDARNLRVSSIAVVQMRDLLQRYGPALCPGGEEHDKNRITLPDGSAHTLKVVCASATNSVAGKTISALPRVALCTPSDDKALPAQAIRVGDADAGGCAKP